MESETIEYKGIPLAKIVYRKDLAQGIHFYTEDSSLMQIGKLIHPKGKIIKAHKHMPVRVETHQPLQEVLYIEKGKVKVTFYSPDDQKVCTRTLSEGDTLLVMNGGHGFEILEESRMIEVKQGPYSPENRKNIEE